MNERLFEDLKREGRVADRVDKERAELLTALLKHPGWTVYRGLIEAQIQSYSENLLQPATGVDSLVASECIKGTMRGLLFAVQLPDTIIGQMKEIQKPMDDEGAEDAN